MNDFRIENVLYRGLYDGKRGLDKRKEGLHEKTKRL
jgi:hypothetical protein